MKHELEATALHEEGQLSQLCDCLLLREPASQEDVLQEGDVFVPVPAELHTQLSTLLTSVLPSPGSFSLLLLHLAQLAPRRIAPHQAIVQSRQQYHAPAGVLEQILANLRRVIRRTDQVAVQPDIAAALVLPHVDYQGVSGILERVYHSISLLKAETILPPLLYETTITFGIGTVAPATKCTEPLLMQAGRVARSVKLLPAPSVQPWGAQLKTHQRTPVPVHSITADSHAADRPDCSGKSRYPIPFMHLPTQLADRLKTLLPYHLACECRCVPVGRSHQSLTVAMAEPTNAHTLHLLAETTSMTIFPVSCEEDELNVLLSNAW